MTEHLALKYRPKSFDDMVGQPLTSVVLKQMVATGTVPSALLFDGPRGTGKTSAARILAMELNPSERENILAGRSLAVLEIDAASHGSVADIRGLIDQLGYDIGAERRVIILDEAHSITREGFNALLKTLEEPPPGVVFVLVTTEPQRLPDTILSRLMEFEFRRVAPVELYSRILAICLAEETTIDPELGIKLAEVSDGSVRDAIKNLDFVTRAGITTVDQYLELTGQKDIGPLLYAALLSGDHSKIFSVVDKLTLEVGDPRVIATALTDTFTDIFVLLAGGEITAAGKALEVREKLAVASDPNTLFHAVQVLWDLKTRVRWTEDQRSALNMALVLVADKLSAGKKPTFVTPDAAPIHEVASEQDAPRVLSLSELQMS